LVQAQCPNSVFFRGTKELSVTTGPKQPTLNSHGVVHIYGEDAAALTVTCLGFEPSVWLHCGQSLVPILAVFAGEAFIP